MIWTWKDQSSLITFFSLYIVQRDSFARKRFTNLRHRRGMSWFLLYSGSISIFFLFLNFSFVADNLGGRKKMLNCDLLFALAPPLFLSVSLIRIFDWSLSLSLFVFFCFVWLCYTLWYHDFCRMRMVTWPRGILHLLLVRTIPVIINWKYQGALVWRQSDILWSSPHLPRFPKSTVTKTGNI